MRCFFLKDTNTTLLFSKCKVLGPIGKFSHFVLQWWVSYIHLSLACPHLHSGKWFNDSDEVLFQQVVVQLGQVSVDDGVVPQLCSVLCEGLEHAKL